MLVKESLKYTQKQIEDVCWNEVNSWDIDTLIQYAYDSLADYYLRSADEEEVENFIGSLAERYGIEQS